MKNIYLVTRTDQVDYDENRAWVIIADNKKDVKFEISVNSEIEEDFSNVKIKKINLNVKKSYELLADYKAG